MLTISSEWNCIDQIYLSYKGFLLMLLRHHILDGWMLIWEQKSLMGVKLDIIISNMSIPVFCGLLKYGLFQLCPSISIS